MIGALRFSSPFIFLGSIQVLQAWNSAAPLLAATAILATLIIAERLPVAAASPRPIRPRVFRALPILYIPAQLAIILWAAHAVTMPGAAALAFVSLAIPVGAMVGVFGVLAAHEMVHSRNRVEQFWGLVMLTGMTYRPFRIAHIYLHHRYAATSRDPSTARAGESFYAFLPRTLRAQIVESYRFERQRCAKRSFGFFQNRIVLDAVATAAVYAGLWWLWGPRAALFLAVESAVGIFVLELFNYIAHYGLSRRRLPDGRLEPMADAHSWNSSAPLGNLLIFNMGRHSHHHRAPSSPYEGLRPVSGAPELPFGYSGAIALALFPPLWRASMDSRLAAIGHTPQTSGIMYSA